MKKCNPGMLCINLYIKVLVTINSDTKKVGLNEIMN